MVTKAKQLAQIQSSWKCHNSFSNFGNDPPLEHAWMLGAQSWERISCVISGEMSLEIFPNIRSYDKEKENNDEKKIKNVKNDG